MFNQCFITSLYEYIISRLYGRKNNIVYQTKALLMTSCRGHDLREFASLGREGTTVILDEVGS